MTKTMEELETLEGGGKQVKENYDYSLLPKEAIHLIVENMTSGAVKYGEGNYLLLGTKKNAGRAEAHMALAHMANRDLYSKESIKKHLINGATRALFALDCYLKEEEDASIQADWDSCWHDDASGANDGYIHHEMIPPYDAQTYEDAKKALEVENTETFTEYMQREHKEYMKKAYPELEKTEYVYSRIPEPMFHIYWNKKI